MRNVSKKLSTSKKGRKSNIRQPIEHVADKYYGAFKVEKWPDDLDGFIEEVMQKWQSSSTVAE